MSSAALNALRRLCSARVSTQEAVAEIGSLITSVVHADAFYAAASEPESGTCLGPGVVSNILPEANEPMLAHEMLVPDFNKFWDLTPSAPVGDLRRATGGRFERSARYRMMRGLGDLQDELRARLFDAGRCSGLLQLNRVEGERQFTDDDIAFVRAAAPLAARALRRTALRSAEPAPEALGPGVAVVDRAGHLVTSTPEADHWLRATAEEGWWRDLAAPGDHVALQMVALRLAAAEEDSVRVRVRTTSGIWLVLQASRLTGSDQVAVVVQPAMPAEMMSLLMDAHGLTARETEVARLTTQGLSTGEMALALSLSPHTVRDHLKAIFEKLAVSSRGELASLLYAEAAPVTHESALSA